TKWLHQGLVIQPFSLSFTLAENMEVSGASFTNGLLHIDLTRNEPEAIAPQRIAISERPALNS
ncbi:Hsp20 family protein, partial [Enterobacter hormaechei]